MITRILDIAGFAACVLVLLALLVDGHRSRSPFVPFAALLDEVMATRPARLTIMLFWWWVGWHFLVSQDL